MNNKNILFFLLGLCIPFLAQAQDSGKLEQAAQIELTKSKSLWFGTRNAAGLALTPLEQFNDVSLGYGYEKGSFKLMQQGERESTLRFNTNGAIQLGEVMLWGNFTFENQTPDECRFNTTLYDPLRDMPYYVADPVSSKWKKQLYDLNLKAASPILWNFLGMGLEMDYTTRTGAKQNDPRSTTYYYTLGVRPGFIFKLGDRHSLGLNGEYEHLYERTVPTISDVQTPQSVFILRGLGHSSPGVIGGSGGMKTMYYKGNKVGGALQYGYKGRFSALADLRYHYKVEDAFQTPSKPQRMGSTRQNRLEGNLQLMLEGPCTHKLTINYLDNSTDGIEFIQVIDNSYEVQQWVTIAQYVRSNYSLNAASLRYDFFRLKENSYSWNAGVRGEYTDKYDEYYLPNSVLKAKNLFAGAYVKKNFLLGKKSVLLAGVQAGYNKNLSGSYVYGGTDPESAVVAQWLAHDIEYMTSDYFRGGLEINYAYKVAEKNALYIKGDCGWLKPSSGTGSRMQARVSVGLLF